MRYDYLGSIWRVTSLNANSSSPYNGLKKSFSMQSLFLRVDTSLYASLFGGRGRRFQLNQNDNRS